MAEGADAQIFVGGTYIEKTIVFKRRRYFGCSQCAG